MAKIFLGSLAFLFSFLIPHSALSAGIKMTNVVVKRSTSGVSVDMTFDRAVAARTMHPAFERNFVQFVLKATRVDAARIIPVSDSEVAKIFAYPYSSDTARVRIILRRDNQWARGKVSVWNNNPKSVRIFVKDPHQDTGIEISGVQKGRPAQASGKASPNAAPAAGAASTTAPEAAPTLAAAPAAEDKSLLKEVIANTREIDINNPESVKAALVQAKDAPPKAAAEESRGPVGTSSDPLRHFTRMALALFGILAFFVGAVLLTRRYASRLKKLPFGKKERLIQVVATHYLGNKKSISLVKITGEYMVVGVSNEGISLISKLGPEVNVDKYLEDRFWGGTFERHLSSYAGDAKVGKEIDLADAAAAKYAYDGARDLGAGAAPAIATAHGPAAALVKGVVDNVELSPLRASIKEKLTKLKPLA